MSAGLPTAVKGDGGGGGLTRLLLLVMTLAIVNEVLLYCGSAAQLQPQTKSSRADVRHGLYGLAVEGAIRTPAKEKTPYCHAHLALMGESPILEVTRDSQHVRQFPPIVLSESKSMAIPIQRYPLGPAPHRVRQL